MSLMFGTRQRRSIRGCSRGQQQISGWALFLAASATVCLTLFANPARASLPISGAIRATVDNLGAQGFETEDAIPDCADSLAAAISVCQAKELACQGQELTDYKLCAKCIMAYPKVNRKQAHKNMKTFPKWLNGIYKNAYLAGIVKSEVKCKKNQGKVCGAKANYLTNVEDVSIGYTRTLMFILIGFGVLIFLVYFFVTRIAPVKITRHPFIWMGVLFLILWAALLVSDSVLLSNFATNVTEKSTGLEKLQQQLAKATKVRVNKKIQTLHQISTRICGEAAIDSDLEMELQDSNRVVDPNDDRVVATWTDLAGKADIKLSANDPGVSAGSIIQARTYFERGLKEDHKAFIKDIPGVVTGACKSPDFANFAENEDNLCAISSTIPAGIGYIIPLNEDSGVHDWLALWSLGALFCLFFGRILEMMAYKMKIADPARKGSLVPRIILVIYLLGAIGCIVAAIVTNLIL